MTVKIFSELRPFFLKEFVLAKLILKVKLKSDSRDCRDDPVVKSIGGSCRGPQFSSQHLHQVAHNHPKSQLWRIWPLRAPAHTCTHPQTDVHIST